MPLQKTLKAQVLVKPVERTSFHLNFFSAIITGLLLGAIALLNMNSVFGYYSIKALQLILFFALGSIYILQKQSFPKHHFAKKSINHIWLIAFLMCVLLSGLYIFFKRDAWPMSFSSSAAFVLPGFLKLSWRLFISIPNKEFSTWFPQKIVSADRAPVTLNSILVRLKLRQYISDVDEKIYTVFIPQHIKLGDFFSRFLSAHNAFAASAIEDKDEQENNYAWEFLKISLYGLQIRRLDPESTMRDNKIKKDSLIYIKRLMLPAKSLSQHKNLLNETA